MRTGKYLEWYFQSIASLYGYIKFLIRNNASETHKIIPWSFFVLHISFFICKKWIYHPAFSLIIFCDSVTGGSRICYKYIWSLCYLFIPSSHNGKSRGDNQLGKPIEPTEFEKTSIRLTMTPEISSRCMTVTYMFGLSFSMNPLCFCRAR